MFLLCYSFPDFRCDLSAPSKNELDMTHLFSRSPPQLPFVSVERRSRWDHLERQPQAPRLWSDSRPIAQADGHRRAKSVGALVTRSHVLWSKWFQSGLCLLHLLFLAVRWAVQAVSFLEKTWVHMVVQLGSWALHGFLPTLVWRCIDGGGRGYRLSHTHECRHLQL